MRQENSDPAMKAKASQNDIEEPDITIQYEPAKVTESEKGPQKSMDEVELPVPSRDVNRVKPSGKSRSDELKARKERIEDDELVIPVREPEAVKKKVAVNHIPPYEKGR